jgi:hypothetical protein
LAASPIQKIVVMVFLNFAFEGMALASWTIFLSLFWLGAREKPIELEYSKGIDKDNAATKFLDKALIDNAIGPCNGGENDNASVQILFPHQAALAKRQAFLQHARCLRKGIPGAARCLTHDSYMAGKALRKTSIRSAIVFL